MGLWLWRFNRFAAYHAVMIAFGWGYATKFVGTHLGKPHIPDEHLTIVTHNVGHMFFLKKIGPGGLDSMARQYAAFLTKNGKPDILCTQETRGAFYPLVGNYLGYDQRFNLKKGTVIMSRYPIKAGGDIPFGKTSNSTLWADIELPGPSTVRVYCVHLQSNRVTKDTEKIIKDDQSWGNIEKVVNKVGGATAVRAEQAEQLRAHILSSPHPVIVCGDFNDTPNSYVYRHIADGLTDAFEEHGFGLGTTFGGALPMLRIDYLLTDPGIRVHDCRVVRDTHWSDHYPVWGVFGLPTGKN